MRICASRACTRFFDIPNGWGLSDLLRGSGEAADETPIEQFAVKTGIPESLRTPQRHAHSLDSKPAAFSADRRGLGPLSAGV